jgi:hypothetical protein
VYASREERRRVRWKFPWVGRRAAGGLDVFCRVSTDTDFCSTGCLPRVERVGSP